MVGVCVKKYYRDVPSIRISEVNLRCHPQRKRPPFSARARLFASDSLFIVQRIKTKIFLVGIAITNCPVNCARDSVIGQKTYKTERAN